jgi:hypothetical protein
MRGAGERRVDPALQLLEFDAVAAAGSRETVPRSFRIAGTLSGRNAADVMLGGVPGPM